MPRVDGERGQHRANLAGELRGQVFPDLRGPLTDFEEMYRFVFEERTKLLPALSNLIQHASGAVSHQ